jgi:hypothetical protein
MVDNVDAPEAQFDPNVLIQGVVLPVVWMFIN